MLDIKKIRQEPDFYKEKLATRGVKPEEIDEVIALDKKRRELLQQTETMKAQRNEASKKIGEAKRNGESADAAIKETRELGDKIKELDAEVEANDAELHDKIYNFMLDEHMKEGYTEVLPPYIVNADSMYGTGQFPKFKEGVYQVNGEDMTLIPTAEVPLTNYYRGEVIPTEELPVYVTALTPSFRSEAGAAGRDTRGLIRMHQFNKVEMVKYTKPENSWDELEKMTANAENILKKLNLPYHVITLTTGDMSFTASETHDLELWMPAQNKYREVSSCSNCLDFQARRMHTQYRDENGKLQYVHTLNGSGLAVGRTVAAILENYQNADGSVTIPEVLVPYMHGVTKITKENAVPFRNKVNK